MKSRGLVGCLLSLFLAGSIFASGCSIKREKFKNVDKGEISCVESSCGLVEKYAVLMEGGDDFLLRKSLTLAYKSFLEFGFKKENIFVLDSYSNARVCYDVYGDTSRGSVEGLYDKLVSEVDSNDSLFTFLSSHGYERKGDGVSFFYTSGESYSGDDFKKFYSSVGPGKGVLLADFCYSGGVAEMFSGGGFVGISSSGNEVSLSKLFSVYFFDAFKSGLADLDGDGLVSIEEAFDLAKGRFNSVFVGGQSPQFFSKFGNGDKIFLGD